MKILLCGERSFAASGLYEKLTDARFDVDCFSRGVEERIENKTTGDVFLMSKNRYLSDSYDIVINFILIKNKSIAENLRYIEELDSFCEKRKVKRLIQISSISVYANELRYVNEDTPVESDSELKGEYATIKVVVDQYLLNKKTSYPVTFIRPGYIVANDMEFSFAGIGKFLPFNSILLLGNKKTSLPLINKVILHESIIRILSSENIESVYLVLENKKGTKYQFLQSRTNRKIIPLPKSIILLSSYVANKLFILSKRQLTQIKGFLKKHISIHPNRKTNC
jgi:nucleoside-diphosphate-sugar epimerase